jgi:oligopeptide/dipeptide ABC transporter ATP-binding protein
MRLGVPGPAASRLAVVSATLLELRNLRVEYRTRGWLGVRTTTVLRGVDLELREGHRLGLVGESGCGKSTLARAVLGLVRPAGGSVLWRGEQMDARDPVRMRRVRRELQAVFQDPFGSLDPRMTVGDSVAEALDALEGITDREKATTRVRAAFEAVGLDSALVARYPHELSGGQCQRVAIARATIARPRLLICDEAVSALDVSVQAQVVNLLGDLCRQRGIGLLFISHNLAVVKHLCEEVAVLYFGSVVEQAPAEVLLATPRHPYTRALLAAVPDRTPGAVGGERRVATVPAGAPPGRPGAGCAFAPRCALATELCRAVCPALEDTGDGARVACHHWRGPVA